MEHNINKLTMLANKQFYLVNLSKKKVYFTVPSLQDFLYDTNLATFLTIWDLDLKNFEEFKVKNRYDLLMMFIKNQMYIDEIFTTVNKYIVDAKIENAGIMINGDRLILDELAFIIQAWRIALGAEDIKVLDPAKEVEPELDEFEKMLKEREAKVKRIKQKVEDSNLELDKVLAAISKEYQFTIDDILPMNLFTIFWYYMHALKYNNYRVETIAAGNGLLKNHKYFIE